MSPFLTPDPGLLFWMILSFACVFGVLAKFGFPVITKMVDERRDYIRQSLARADEANRRLEEIELKSDKILEEATRRRTEIIRQATAHAAQIMQKAKEEATAVGKQKLDEALRRIEMQQQKALGEIRAQVALLSVDMAEKILRHQLDRSEGHEQLMRQLLDEMEGSDFLKN
jgi:F-type H+-transporting ATPase subunit b